MRSTFMDSLALPCSVPLDILELYEGLFFVTLTEMPAVLKLEQTL